jgi:CheY-like chemotaxis protein
VTDLRPSFVFMNGATEQSRPRILLIEDNDDHAELVCRALEEYDPPPDVTRISDGEAALTYLARGMLDDPEGHPRPDLVLLDLRLPRVDGLDVLREIKTSAALRSLPVVVLSSSQAESDLAQAYAGRVNAYLVKPADFAGLDDMLRDTRTFWLEWNRQPPA